MRVCGQVRVVVNEQANRHFPTCAYTFIAQSSPVLVFSLEPMFGLKSVVSHTTSQGVDQQVNQ